LTKSTLNSLQKEFLSEFFRREDRFFLSGGAALVGFYFGHRETHDLDLFTIEDAMDEGFAAMKDVAKTLRATVEAIQTSPDFRRVLIRRGNEGIVVDLIHEYVYQLDPDKPVISGIRVDSPGEILANKLCALLSRSEIRDLVDIRELENAGFRVEDALSAAALKDSGFTPGQLGWILSQIKFGDDVTLPGNIPPAELREYLDDLIARLARSAFPK
jgi:hypothetical protein